MQTTAETLITLTSDIVAAHVSHNSVAVSELPDLIGKVYGALAGLGQVVEAVAVAPTPAVSIRTSVRHDYIVCLEDGKKLKMLKRHLSTHFPMTPEQYRARWNLPADYPMVAPAYAEKRRELAKSIGLGRKPGKRAAAVAPEVAPSHKTPVKAVPAKAAPAKVTEAKATASKATASKAAAPKGAPRKAPGRKARVAAPVEA